MRGVRVKICGLRTPADVAAVAAAGAAYAGFVFFAKSPRNLTIAAARGLALAAPEGLCKVALTVDADDATLDAILAEVPLDGLPVMKAIGVAGEADLAGLIEMSLAADQLLIDAKPAPGADLPGGNGLAFDWRLLIGRKWLRPWMLAGGLTPANVAEAVRLTGARQVDVSSGVESAPGVKDPARIAAFVEAAQGVKAGVPILR